MKKRGFIITIIAIGLVFAACGGPDLTPTIAPTDIPKTKVPAQVATPTSAAPFATSPAPPAPAETARIPTLTPASPTQVLPTFHPTPTLLVATPLPTPTPTASPTVGPTSTPTVIPTGTPIHIRRKPGRQPAPTAALPRPAPTPAFEAKQYQGFWEPGLKSSIAGELEHLKSLGVNTMSFVPSRSPLPDGTFRTKSDAKQFVIAQIVESHKQGIQVYLVPNFRHPSPFPDRRIAETYLENFTPIVLEWAEIAEEYGVALFPPGNELDKPFPKDLVATWLHDIIPKINERYDGLTIAKLKDVFDMDFSGYDYVGFTNIGRQNPGGVREEVELAKKYAARDGARGVIISEFGWNIRSDEGEETQAKTIEQVFQESWGEVDGYFIVSWLLPGYSVKGRPAEQVIKQWFTVETGVRPPPVPTSKPVNSSAPGYNIFAPGGMGGDCDNNPTPKFTAHITELSKISYLSPAGTVQGGDLKPHGYLHNVGSNPEVPVYAPINSYLIDFAYYEGYTGVGHYTFKFQVSCEVAYYFDHLRTVVDKINVVTPDTPASDSRGVVVSLPIFFQAGELIGYTGGNSTFANWDFGVLNTATWNELPDDPYVYSPNVEKYRFAVCPYGYYDETMRARYMTLLGEKGCGP